MKKTKQVLIASLFVYALMFNGDYQGDSWDNIGDCNQAAEQAGSGYYCIWIN